MWWSSCVPVGRWTACSSGSIRAGPVITGTNGLLPALLKEALERGLAAELTDHLGYERGESAPSARPNTRNGTTAKTVDSEVGPFEIEVPRDRAGSFTPRLVRKGQRRLDGLDSMIISLYAGGMTVRDIRHHLASTIGVDLSVGTIPEDHRRGAPRGRPEGGARGLLEAFLPRDLPRARSAPMAPRRPPGLQPRRPHRRRSSRGRAVEHAGHLGPSR